MTDNGCYAGPNARFLAAAPRSHGLSGRRVGNALSASVLAHVVGGLTILMIAGRLSTSHDTAALLLHNVEHLAWIGGGEGGSGKSVTAPAQQLSAQGRDATTIPARAQSEARMLEQTTARDLIDVPAIPTNAGVQELPGTVTAVMTTAIAPGDGPGIADRAGSGRGLGNGPGDGDGLGSGHTSGFGDGLRPGNGVSTPRLIREVKPGYTGEALRARIQGTVRLQAIVATDGSVSAVRVIRSLDATFGLDQEAMKTVKQWRFVPGSFAGRPVPVVIEIELTFTLR